MQETRWPTIPAVPENCSDNFRRNAAHKRVNVLVLRPGIAVVRCCRPSSVQALQGSEERPAGTGTQLFYRLSRPAAALFFQRGTGALTRNIFLQLRS